MEKKQNNQNTAKKENKRGFHLSTWIKRLFFPGRELDFLQEEQVQSPLRSIIKRFFHNKIAVTGMVLFILMLLLVVVGPLVSPLDITYSDSTQQNVGPGYNMQSIPSELKGKIQSIGVGTTYCIACDTDGKVYTWGYTRITEKLDIANIPDEVQEANIVEVAAGYDHVLALSDEGRLYVWGNNRLGQADIPERANAGKTYVQIGASTQFSCALTQDGYLYVWGNDAAADCKIKKEYQNHIKKFAMSDYAYCCLMDDGSVKYTAYKTSSAYAEIPEELSSDVIDIAATANTFVAVKSDGSLYFWGNVTGGEDAVPEYTGEIVKLYGGRYHYTALLDNGDVISWGGNHFGQTDVPNSLKTGSVKVTDIFAGYYQNYAITDTGDVVSWGLKGYLMGTDYLGRDIFNRLINGGKVTMTVGAVSVIITMIVGLIVGGISGYFGGWIDIVLMRVAEVISGIPFLPFAMILSSIIPNTVTLTERMYLIMVVLGLLSWPSLARLVRAQILQVREQEYVMAAKAMGVKEGTIIAKHILPNILSVILVNVTLSFATCMLTESSLSYLGFGIIPPTPTWGNMLTGCSNSVVIQQYWWRWVFPTIALAICTISINLIGDGLRDAVDPKAEGR